MNRDKRAAIFATFKAANPAPTTELEYADEFELLVAVILSAQATDVSVNKATRQLFAVANTPAAILALGVDGLKRYQRREMLLDQPVLQGVIGHDRQPTTGLQLRLYSHQPRLQLPQLVVDGNAQGLEYARQRLVEHPGPRGRYGFPQSACSN